MQNKNKSEDPSRQESDQYVTNPQSTPCDQNSAECAEKNKDTSPPENKPKSFMPWDFCFQLALVIATCTSAGVAVYQWKAMKIQTNIMQGQLNAMGAQTSAAFQQVSAAKSSIKIADKSLKDTQESGKEQSERAEKALNATIENFRLDQRAWITTKEMAFKGYTSEGKQVLIKEGHPVRFKITYTNTGKTPARVLATKTYLFVMESGVKPPLQKKAIIATENQPFTLFPNGTYSHTEVVSETYTSNQIEVLKSGQYVMYIYGMIPYEDVFGQIRWTQFCNYIAPDFTTFAVCPFYNETDKTRKYKQGDDI